MAFQAQIHPPLDLKDQFNIAGKKSAPENHMRQLEVMARDQFVTAGVDYLNKKMATQTGPNQLS